MTIRIDGTNTTGNPGITGGDADTGLQFGTDEVKIVTGGNDRVTVDSSGQVGIGITPAVDLDVSGKIRASTGILFGTDTAAVNTLDDYEEGTWTPVICGVTPTIDSAFYTKIGRLVIVKARVNVITPPSVSSSEFNITGLPFVGSVINGYNGFLVGYTSNHDWPGNLNGGVTSFFPEIRLVIAGSTNTWTINDYIAIRGANNTLEFECTYFV